MNRISRRKRQRDIYGWAIIVACVAIVAGASVVFYRATAQSVKIDPVTMCPQDGPRSITVILLDMTDPVTPVQREAIIKRLEDIKRRVPRYGELALFTVKSAPNSLLSPELALCNPGQKSDVSELTGNPRLMEMRWHRAFADKFDHALTELLTAKESDSSPILESIQQVGVQMFLGSQVENIPKELIIVSDMLQNTKGLSHYHEIASFQQFRRSPYYVTVRPSLPGVKVKILYLRRPNAYHIQGLHHIKFWEQYFLDAGATLEDVVSIEG